PRFLVAAHAAGQMFCERIAHDALNRRSVHGRDQLQLLHLARGQPDGDHDRGFCVALTCRLGHSFAPSLSLRPAPPPPRTLGVNNPFSPRNLFHSAMHSRANHDAVYDTLSYSTDSAQIHISWPSLIGRSFTPTFFASSRACFEP